MILTVRMDAEARELQADRETWADVAARLGRASRTALAIQQAVAQAPADARAVRVTLAVEEAGRVLALDVG